MTDEVTQIENPEASGATPEQPEVVPPPRPPVRPVLVKESEPFDEPTTFPSFLQEGDTDESNAEAPLPDTEGMSMPLPPLGVGFQNNREASFAPAESFDAEITPPEVPHIPEPPETPAISETEEIVSETPAEASAEDVSSFDETVISAPVRPEVPVSEETESATEQAPEEENALPAEATETEKGDGENTAADDNATDEKTAESDGAEGENSDDEPASKRNTDYRSASFLEDLFANENDCITVPNGSFPVKDETRALLALFANGRFFVSEAARFDGKVLGFEYLARRRHLQVGDPEYVPAIVINDIYEYAAKNTSNRFVPPVIESDAQEQVRMQRDFVTIVSRAAAAHVSDIHIVVADHTTIMFRVNGLMQTEMEYNKEWGESFVRAAFASADISDANYAQNEYQAAQKLGRTPLRGSNGRLNLPRNVLGIRLQFNPIAFGSRYVVMRLLYAEEDTNAATDLEALGFTKRETEVFYQMRAVPTGMIVISGPTGSGKSTTLQRNMIAMLQERKYEINLITVEDPPEYPIPGARQMPVTNAMVEDAKEREFTKALSAALRSDPDALMIGEIRTLSAADLAFRGALSGHNVWTTLHANSAPAVLMRLKDIGVEDFKLQDPSIMKGMMAQRLFRKVCPHCCVKASDKLDHPAVQRLRRALGDEALEQCFLRGEGCEECDFRGVKGRTVVAEFIQPDATFLDLSIRGEAKKALNYWVNDLGGITLRESAIDRMLTGLVDIEEVERWTGFLDQQVMA